MRRTKQAVGKGKAPAKRKRQAARKSSPTARNKTNSAASVSRALRRRNLTVVGLSLRSQAARDRAVHVLAAMRRDSKLSLTHAAKLHGVKPETVKKYFSSALSESHGQFQVAKSDRYSTTLYLPDRNGHAIAIKTRSSKDRKALGRYLRDVGRYLGGKRDALAAWQGKKISDFELVTDGRTLVAIEPALSDFALYRAFNGGAV